MAAVRLVLLALLVGIVTFAATSLTHGLSPSLIEPDEGGHYVNALFLGDWLRAGLPSPLPFATGFYAHFPRLSIGHWPPGWYMLEAPFFALFRPSPLGASWASAFLAGVPGIAILWAMDRIRRPRLGLVAAGAYALLPLTLDGARFILVDQPLALVVALAAMAWAAASERPERGPMLRFALLAAACPLVKGNGALIALVPAIDIALGRRWSLLRRPWLWGAALLAMAIVAPWYWLSFRISAEGFNYAPGAAYAWMALVDNAGTIVANLGWGGMALGLFAVATRATSTEEARIVRLSMAVILATLAFQSAVPASLVARYCAPLLPWAVVLAGVGAVRLSRWGRRGRTTALLLVALALVPAIINVVRLRPKPDIDAPTLAAAMVSQEGLWLVDGRSGAEGALIAAAAHADNGRRRIWVARASQWLSSSDFMGRGYRLTVADPTAVAALLDRLGAAGTVSVASGGRLGYPHSRLLLQATRSPEYETARRPFRRGAGSVVIARRRAPISPNAALLSADPVSAKVGKMAGALD